MRPTMHAVWFAAVVVALFLATATAEEEAKRGKIAVGSPAPDFRLNDQHGKALRLSELGKDAWVILAFYPKAETPG